MRQSFFTAASEIQKKPYVKNIYLCRTYQLCPDEKIIPFKTNLFSHTLQECVENAKKRRISMKSTEEFWTKRQHTDSSAMEGWILARHNGVLGTK